MNQFKPMKYGNYKLSYSIDKWILEVLIHL